VRYVPRMTKNLISIGALEAEGLRGTLREGVRKMSSGSLVALKGIRYNNFYYLKGSTVIGNLVYSEQLDLWNSRIRHVCLDSLQAMMQQGVLKGAVTCNRN